IKGNLEIKAVKWIDEVLTIALTQQPTPIPDAPTAVVAPADDKRVRRNGRRPKQVVPAH
ncbi:MAG: Lon protease, partial [Gammaproteobacteria bacterium]|nr:Lon protease [Gammaproteobacteria bacterium]